ncbi:MAG: McrC family protein [Pseudomonadota bacterium]
MSVLTTLFEFDTVVNAAEGSAANGVPPQVFAWLEAQCLKCREEEGTQWIRLTQRSGRRAIQFTQYVGVIRAPCGYQIEILPKIAKQSHNTHQARKWLTHMVQCLLGFRHIQHDEADSHVVRMPLLEVFIQQFLGAVQTLVKSGLRSDYADRQDNLPQCRGKLLLAQHLRLNTVRSDRFFTAHHDFSPDRAENRLLHTALRSLLSISQVQEHQQLARELCFIFNDVPYSRSVEHDSQCIRLDHGMRYYERALDWALLLLRGTSPLLGHGSMRAPSLLFPMEALFEAYVAYYLPKQLEQGFYLKTQANSRYLVEHQAKRWFKMKPDFLVKDNNHVPRLLLDAKWKLLDARNKREKYNISQGDLYQLYAYGQHYLEGKGDMVLIYPKTEAFDQPLPVFRFPQTEHLRLWALPFCLEHRKLLLPDAISLTHLFSH